MPDLPPTSLAVTLFMPKCHCLPFLARCISGSRSPLWFLLELGVAISVASITVPVRVGLSNPPVRLMAQRSSPRRGTRACASSCSRARISCCQGSSVSCRYCLTSGLRRRSFADLPQGISEAFGLPRKKVVVNEIVGCVQTASILWSFFRANLMIHLPQPTSE